MKMKICFSNSSNFIFFQMQLVPLRLGTGFSHNIMRHFSAGISEKNLLLVARLATIPFAFAAMLIAAFYQSGHSVGAVSS
jgi:hypothetical protein